MEEKTCCENTTGQKNLWSENCLKKQVDVEWLTLNMEEKNQLWIYTTGEKKTSGHKIVKYKYKD